MEKNIPITPITREEMVRNQYSYSTVWFPIDLENKIIEKLATNKCINRPRKVDYPPNITNNAIK